jgi:hypothetical protein
VVPRAVPIVEAMSALVIIDALIIAQNAKETAKSLLPPPLRSFFSFSFSLFVVMVL